MAAWTLVFGLFLGDFDISLASTYRSISGYGSSLPPKPANHTPCCVDTLSPGVCHSLLANDHETFINMCRKNADFSFMQCCFTCHFSEEAFEGLGNVFRERHKHRTRVLAPNGVDLYNMDVQALLLSPISEHNKCFDRHSHMFCERFLARRAGWNNKLTCERSSLAFRICRKTCGYCTNL